MSTHYWLYRLQLAQEDLCGSVARLQPERQQDLFFREQAVLRAAWDVRYALAQIALEQRLDAAEAERALRPPSSPWWPRDARSAPVPHSQADAVRRWQDGDRAAYDRWEDAETRRERVYGEVY